MDRRDVYVPCLAHVVIPLISLVQCDIATILLLLSGWVRYAGTARSLSKGGAYALIILGQVGRAPGNPFLPLSSHGFPQGLSGVTQSAFRILAPKCPEQWFDRKDRITAMMITFIGKGLFQLRGIPTAESTLFQRTPSEGRWFRCCHPHSRIRASRCVHIRSVTVVRMPTWNATSKILLLAIILTAVIPIDLLVFEAPPTPPCMDFSSSNRFRRLNGFPFSIFWLSQTVPIRLCTPASYDGTQLPSRVVYDFE